jgi:SPP1 gp7 family putative phage head morphogenesis protein
LRDKFEAEMARRFRKLKALIKESVETNDCFGLTERKPLQFATLQALPPGAFAFATDEGKINGFMSWLADETEKNILDPEKGMRVIRGPAQLAGVGSSKWTDLYISSGYKKGIGRAYTEMNKAGYPVPAAAPVSALFNAPIHANGVGAIYTRTYNELQGITDAMAQQMSRSLAESLAEGRNPRQIARILMNRIEKVGDLATVDSLGRFIPALRRARILARTEVIRAHHVATINSYESAGVEGVHVKAEWSTAGDDRVCEICEGLEGQIFTLKEIRPMIPRHPQCRCVALPAKVKIDKKKVKALYGEEKLFGPLPPIPKGAALAQQKKLALEAEGYIHPDDISWDDIDWKLYQTDPEDFIKTWYEVTPDIPPPILKQLAKGAPKGKLDHQLAAFYHGKYKQAYHAKGLHVQKGILKKATTKRVAAAKKGRAIIADKVRKGLPPKAPKELYVPIDDIPNDVEGAVDFGKRIKLTQETAAVTPGGSTGSTGAKVFLDDENARWIVKDYNGNRLQVESEWISNRIYAANKINVPEARLAVLPDGRKVIAIKKIADPGLTEMGAKHVDWAAGTNAIQKGYATDAFVGNWDVAGTGWDNILVVPGKKASVYRIDQGGSLFFRAQGGQKGAQWSGVVDEIFSLRNADFPVDNSYSVRLFAKLNDADVAAQIKLMMKTIKMPYLNALVKDSGMALDKADELLAVLEQRLAYMRQWRLSTRKALRAGAKHSTQAHLLATDTPVTTSEWNTIVNARGNGYSLRWDTTDIEDQQIHFWIEKRDDGKEVLKAWIKVRDEGQEAVTALMKGGGAGADVKTFGVPLKNFTATETKFKEAIVGIASRAGKGEAFAAYDFTRVAEADGLLKKLVDAIKAKESGGFYPKGTAKAIKAHYDPWLKDLKAAIKGKPSAARWKPHTTSWFGGPQTPTEIVPVTELRKMAAKAPIELKASQTAFRLSDIDKGHLRRTQTVSYASGKGDLNYKSWNGQAGDVRIRAFHRFTHGDQTIAGLVEMEIEDVSQAGAKAITDVIGRMGVKTGRPTALQAEDMYLRQCLYAVRDKSPSKARWWSGVKTELSKFPDVTERVNVARQMLAKEMKMSVENMLKLDSYNIEGKWGAFNHGKIRWNRPDLFGEEWNKFVNDHAVFHSFHSDVLGDVQKILNSGGRLVSNGEKMRMGIPPGGMSPGADIISGGGDYAYTRIMRRQARRYGQSEGVYWNSRVLARTDTQSWVGDSLYGGGDVLDEAFSMGHRRTTVKGWAECAANESNETLFKGGLSLLEDLDQIVCGSESDKKAVIKLFKDNGYKTISGRKIEEVVTYKEFKPWL